ncbi:hypothetical protein PspLS_11069 [Pyricularia sp. CBS 133598]|nr:hypothetical protein PspLS_11069 [Pyricularia sp. CBS 133598]
MRFFATLPFMATAALALATGLVDRADLPDGGYRFERYENGTITAFPLDKSGVEGIPIKPIVPQPESEAESGLQKRAVDCWPGHALDHAGVDQSVKDLKAWAGTGGRTLASGAINSYVGYQQRGSKCSLVFLFGLEISILTSLAVIVYYCIDKPWSSGNLDIADIDYALWRMDTTCPRYTSSYFRWDNTYEIVGKANVNWGVCCGGGTGPANC